MDDVELAERAVLFEAERARLVGLAGRVLADRAEGEDVVQQAWLRLQATRAEIANLPGWLTTVTTRLCLDRLRSRTPVPVEEVQVSATAPDASSEVLLAESVGQALRVVLDRLSPRERVAFVLHESFGVAHPTIAEVLETTPAAARQLTSRARAKVQPPAPAARAADEDVVAAFFDGAASAAVPVRFAGRPAAAWFHRGEARVVFDFGLVGGLVRSITFRAAPEALAQVSRVRRAAPPRPE